MALAQMGLDAWNACPGDDLNGLLSLGQEPSALDVGALDVRCRGHHLWLPDPKLETF